MILEKGDVIVTPIPFSDLSGIKKRPALVVAGMRGDDVVVCAITTQIARQDEYSIALEVGDFEEVEPGVFWNSSYIRANKIYTIEKSIVIKKLGKISGKKLGEVIEAVKKVLDQK